MFKTILFPLDHSREAFETISKAIALAKSHRSQIIILSVIQPDRAEMNTADLVIPLLQNAKEQVEQAGVPCTILEKKGNPAFLICDVADEMEVDVIVMGTKGIKLHEGIESIAARVIQLAPCPVLVVP